MANGLLGQGSLSTYNPTFREKVTDALRGLLFTDDREGQQKAERLSNVLEFTPYGVATAVDDVKEAVGQGDYATAGMMGAMAMVPGPSPKIKAYHGSPHSFDKFSMDKIGTGEGAQAYGHGLYFAEAEDVARGYRNRLAPPSIPSLGGQPIDRNLLRDVALDIGIEFPGQAVTTLQSRLKSADDIANYAEKLAGIDIESLRKTFPKVAQDVEVEKAIFDELVKRGLDIQRPNKGSMYEVNINASPDDFLDWDKPLSEQPEKVRQAIAASKAKLPPNAHDDLGGDYSLLYDPQNRPGQFLNTMEAIGGRPDSGEQLLRKAGIPGIKYLDAGSRGKGDGSRNYVVFDDKLIEIVRKYGIAGASAMLGYNVLNMVDPAQARQMQEMDAQRPQMARSGW